jgi:hypothetical protein
VRVVPQWPASCGTCTVYPARASPWATSRISTGRATEPVNQEEPLRPFGEPKALILDMHPVLLGVSKPPRPTASRPLPPSACSSTTWSPAACSSTTKRMRDGFGGNSHLAFMVPFHMSCSRFAILSARCARLSFREAYFNPQHCRHRKDHLRDGCGERRHRIGCLRSAEGTSVCLAVAAALVVAVILTLWPEVTVPASTIRHDALLAAVGLSALWLVLEIVRGIKSSWRRWSSRPYF